MPLITGQSGTSSAMHLKLATAEPTAPSSEFECSVEHASRDIHNVHGHSGKRCRPFASKVLCLRNSLMGEQPRQSGGTRFES